MSVMDSFRDEVEASVKKALEEMGADVAFTVEVPSADAADLAVPCFTMSKALRRAPAEIAADLAGRISPSGMISSVSAVNGNLQDQEALYVRHRPSEILRGPRSPHPHRQRRDHHQRP